ncbi:GDP-mannose 4,6-dehydratase [Maribacter sp. X9]|uniref:GDP-mannose 4,6-dehydratase n=1 Tax=Maribacter sp. X9 TaxID=3402159 RepID=UPI003AF38A09
MDQPFKGNVLITGINGFTGFHLEYEMKRLGYFVFGTTFSEPFQKNHFQCDVLDKAQVKKVLSDIKPDYIIHLAAISFVASENTSSIYDTNVIGTLNLLEGLDELGLQVNKILIASSAAVYGNVEGELSEEMCPKPINHYGNSKLAMEHMVSNFFNKFDIILMRPFNYTGIAQNKDFLIPKIVDHFKRGLDVIELGNLHTYREYNSVKSFVTIYIELLNSSFSSGVLNICSGRTYSIENILKMMKDIANRSIRVEVNPLFVRKNEIIELKGSTKRLFDALGHPVDYIKLKKTLTDMFLN